jgi:hypothetical protein
MPDMILRRTRKGFVSYDRHQSARTPHPINKPSAARQIVKCPPTAFAANF